MSSITIQSWGTGHRVTAEKEIENDRYRNEGGPVQSGAKQSESPNPCNPSMARLQIHASSDKGFQQTHFVECDDFVVPGDVVDGVVQQRPHCVQFYQLQVILSTANTIQTVGHQ